HANNAPNWTIDPMCVARLHVASGSKVAGEAMDVKTDANAQFQTRSGMTLSTARPLLKAAMQVLTARWPGPVPFDELRREAGKLLVQRDGQRLTDLADGKAALGSVIDHALNSLAAQAMLVE